ncbi:MAG: YecA family protein, partial [Saprospiraceae bacterium]
ILTKELGLMILSSNKFGFGDENYEEVLPEFKATHKEESLGKIPVYKCSTTHIIFSKEIKKLTADDVLSLEKEDQDLLRADMHLALQDSMARFDEYQDREWDDYEMSFPYHALNILAFIGNRESLEIALNLLRQDEKFIDFWCADVADWYFDNILILLGKDNLDLLEGFLLEPYIFSYHKATISPVLAQIALNFPEKRDEVIQIFEKIYQTFKERKDDTTLFDTRFLSFLNCEIIHVKAEGLLHYVKWLSDNNWIDGMVTGNYEDIKTDCEHENTEKWRKELPVNIAEVYTEAHIQRGRERRSEYRQELESLEEQEQSPVNKFLMDLLFKDLKAFREEGLGKVEKEDPRSIPVRTEKKIGRNEPCPCGSGKKYKKCCLRK